jgi:prevent-host-death family protein
VIEVGVHEAKSTLSELLRRVATGEEITITRGGEPVALLVPVPRRASRAFGADEGAFEVPEDFNEPLPPELLRAFEGAE